MNKNNSWFYILYIFKKYYKKLFRIRSGKIPNKEIEVSILFKFIII